MTNLRRIRARLRASRDPVYGVGDCIHRVAGSRVRAFYAVGVIVILCISGCNAGPPKATCQDLNAACASAVAQNLSQIMHEHQVCHYVVDGKPAETSQNLECQNPAKAYEGVTLISVGENGNWSSETQRLPGKIYRIVFLSGCVKGAMC